MDGPRDDRAELDVAADVLRQAIEDHESGQIPMDARRLARVWAMLDKRESRPRPHI